jgi:tRNA threonylcarbamoyladenosine modification (KEOPS) complex  Pcc1 subunit
MEKIARINLEQFRSEDKARKVKSKVFTGRDRGEMVRKDSKIDELESQNDKIIIEIPADIYSINPSFFEELFLNVVTKLKKEAFLNKFSLEVKGEYNFQNELMEAVDRILNDATAIG